MAGMGPPPKRRSEKRRPNRDSFSKVDLVLPASGRSGPPPDWPLPVPLEAELKIWGELWALPQAVAWERFGWTRAVARYVRDLLEAEERRAPVQLKSEARQHEDRLGLNPLAMLRLRWEIGGTEEAKTEAGAKVTNLRAVEAG